MKSAVIIRRVDDLGRIFIPKEIRRIAGIKEGTPMEIFWTEDKVVLKEYHEESEPILTLDDAILHCKEKAKADCSKCAKKHMQLAEWLEELRNYREKQIPKNPEPRSSEVSGEYYRCPTCELVIGKLSPYCMMCGQAIKWDLIGV